KLPLMRGRLINDRLIDDRLIHARPINDARQHLIVALDVSSAVAARKIVAAVGDSASTYKVGMQLYTAEGPQIVSELVAPGRRIFLDLKYHDIPTTVASAVREAAQVRSCLGHKFAIVNPGIRPAGADRGDQSRVVTPAEAIAAGATHIVVGRPITEAANPAAEAEKILQEMGAVGASH